MRTIEQLIGMPVLSIEEGEQLGKVEGVELDPTAGQIVYLRFKGEGRRPDGVISWNAVRSVGEDAVTVTSITDARDQVPADKRAALASRIGDREVHTASGSRLGRVVSYVLDEHNGRVVKYRVNCGGLLDHLLHKEVEFPHTAIRTFGHDVIIVDDSVLPAKKL